MNKTTGFILTAESLDINGKCELRIYGTCISGPFKIIIDNHKPLFFIKSSCPEKYTEKYERKHLELTDFNENPLDAVYFRSLDSFFNGRRYLKDEGITLYESDVRAEDRYLMERFINGSVSIEGSSEKQGNLLIFRNPVLKKGGDYRPDLKTLSIDIETGRDQTIYSSAFHTKFRDIADSHVLMRGQGLSDDIILPVQVEDTESDSAERKKPDRPVKEGFNASGKIEYVSDEKSLIIRIIDYIRNCDPDIIIGWHVIGFDLKFIERRAGFYRIPFKIGRGFKAVKINERKSGLFSASIEGRLVIDGPQTLRMAFYKFESYSLENVSQQMLGRGKDITPEKDKVAEIERRFLEDKKALAFYNLEDAVLVSEIFAKTAILSQLISRSLITGLQIDKVHMSVASFDHFMLPMMHRKGYAAPDTNDVIPCRPAAGGYVFTSDPGLYKHVIVMDFKSLYPSIIRTFFIDPLSKIKSDSSTVKTPGGISFSSNNHILPGFLKELMEKREAAKKNNDMNLSQAVKILMNSFYGVMGTTGCRFYNPDLPSAITETGQWILKTSSAFLKESGYSVIYGDTDSVFVCLKEAESRDPQAAGNNLAERINRYFSRLISDTYNVKSELEIEFEKYYEKFFLTPVRYSEGGARKRYAGLLENGSIEFKGLETVRSDWTDLAKDFQKELFSLFFRGENLSEWIKEFVANLKEGKFDDKLVYRKRLSRPASEYVKNRPPHVKAALLLDPEGNKKIRTVSYIMTADGPVPDLMFTGDIDYAHYIEKQIRPIADAVLFAVNEDFDSITGGKQLNLFST